MYGLIKTKKENNPVRVITSGCGNAIEYLLIFVEKYFYKEVNKRDSRIKDTPDMMNIIDMIMIVISSLKILFWLVLILLICFPVSIMFLV